MEVEMVQEGRLQKVIAGVRICRPGEKVGAERRGFGYGKKKTVGRGESRTETVLMHWRREVSIS